MFITVRVVNMVLGKKFILASNSNSRFKLLKNAGLDFIKTPPLCNEEKIKTNFLKNKNNKKNLPKLLAKEKALSISKKKPNFKPENNYIGLEKPCSSTSTQLELIDNKDFVTVYPNPFKDNLVIMSSEKWSRLSIYNVLGSLVYDDMAYQANKSLDLSLQTGIYYVKLKIDDREQLVKVVKK